MTGAEKQHLHEMINIIIWRIVLLAGVVAIASGILSESPLARDDTDPGEWGKRSEIAARTDSLTGCQYLTTKAGGLTPRLDAEGRHIGCRGAK